MYAITRMTNEDYHKSLQNSHLNYDSNEEYWSSDSTRNFWQSKSSENFNPDFIKSFDLEFDAIAELGEKIRPNYLNNMSYGVKKMNVTTAAIDADAWVIARTNRRTGKVEFLNTDTSVSVWSDDLSGNFTRKFISKREALEVMSGRRASSMQSQYNFALMDFNQAQRLSQSEGDNGNYEDKNGSKTGVGLK